MFTRRLARSTASVICFFRVLAIVPTYNEEDIIARTIEVLIQQGLDLYLIGNCDRELVRAWVFLDLRTAHSGTVT